jgi:hypothetical protein
MTPEELIERHETKIINYSRVAAIRKSSEEVIDCIKALLARAKKAETAIEGITKLNRFYSYESREMRDKLEDILYDYHKEK